MEPIGLSIGSLCRFLGVLGGFLGALWDQFGLQLSDFVPSWKPCDENLGISWVTLSPLGSDLASFGSGLRIKFFALSLEATG